MQTTLIKSLVNTPRGDEAERILRACVHCGFCTATCPTYQLLGDELDGPRGRIYLIKSMLEGQQTTQQTMTHLDRCLTCHACETTCPSGVEYGKLLDIGRRQIEEKVVRPWQQKFIRQLLLKVLPYRKRFTPILRMGQLMRFILPRSLKKQIPLKNHLTKIEIRKSNRKIILFGGCVQPALVPEINRAVRKVLNHLGVEVVEFTQEQCCGALPHHLNAEDQALDFMRKNIDLYGELLSKDIEAIISTASGCGVQLKEYAYLLRNDPDYATRAKKVSELTKDIVEYLQGFDLDELEQHHSETVVFQSPCTLQHGQKLNGVTERLLIRLGFKLTTVEDPHLCCGSAGVYSLLQKDISLQLREDKLDKLTRGNPTKILTANIGCRQHLQAASTVPVRHWIEEVAARVD